MHIGKRIFKTALAVLITLLIYLFLMALDLFLDLDRNINQFAPTNWYTPFFASIATCYAMQNNPQGSISQAKIRSIGSIIGGVFGAIIIFIFEAVYLKVVNANSLQEVSNTVTFRLLEYTITSVGVIFLIPISVKLKWPQATFISCLTYLSVTISIRNGGMNVMFFAFNRIISTIIGVLISLYINTFPHFKKRNKDILFVSSVDNALLDQKHELSNYSKYMLNNLSNKNCELTFMTTRALTSLNRIFKNVNLVKPIICMNGASIYNPIDSSFKSLTTLDMQTRSKIEEIFNGLNLDYFTYLINNDVLNCYYNKLEGIGSKHFYDTRKEGAFYLLTEALVPLRLKVSQFVVIDKNEVIEKIVNILKDNKIDNKVDIIVYPYKKLDGYSYLKLNSNEANKHTCIQKIYDRNKYNYLIVIGGGHSDIEAMKNANFSICLDKAPDYVKEVANYILPSSNPDDLLKFIYKIYNTNNYQKYLESLKTK